jgi:hypothetical protein
MGDSKGVPRFDPFHMTEAGGRDATLRNYDKDCGVMGVVVRDAVYNTAYNKEAYADSIRDEIRNIDHVLRRHFSDAWMHARTVRAAQLVLVKSEHDHMKDPRSMQPRYINMTDIGVGDEMLGQYDRYFGIIGIVPEMY